MGLSSYAVKCRQYVSELMQSLTSTDINELRTDCASLGLKEWYAWVSKNSPLIFAYIEATSSARQKKKLWQDPVLKRRLVLAAQYELNCAAVLLEGLVQYESLLLPGDSYRGMAVTAANAYRDIFFQEIPDWPFDDPDPFS